MGLASNQASAIPTWILEGWKCFSLSGHCNFSFSTTVQSCLSTWGFLQDKRAISRSVNTQPEWRAAKHPGTVLSPSSGLGGSLVPQEFPLPWGFHPELCWASPPGLAEKHPPPRPPRMNSWQKGTWRREWEKQQQGKPSKFFKTAKLEGFGGDESSRMDGEDETQNCTFPPDFELFPWGFSDFFFLLKGQLSCQSWKSQAPSLTRV